MTVTANPGARAAPIAGPAPIPVPKTAAQRRWRPGLVALAVALVATGGLSATYAITLVGSTTSYLAVNKKISAGAQITASDLVTVRISGDPSLRPIPSSQAESVVGHYAAVELFAGALLTEGQVVDVPLGGSGTYLVSLGLSPSKVPAGRIKPGAKVVLVATPANQFAQADKPEGPPATYPGTVVDVTVDEGPPQTIYVNVSVAQADGAAIATLAAADRVVIVLAGG